MQHNQLPLDLKRSVPLLVAWLLNSERRKSSDKLPYNDSQASKVLVLDKTQIFYALYITTSPLDKYITWLFFGFNFRPVASPQSEIQCNSALNTFWPLSVYEIHYRPQLQSAGFESFRNFSGTTGIFRSFEEFSKVFVSF
jgi:hypothetical protein